MQQCPRLDYMWTGFPTPLQASVWSVGNLRLQASLYLQHDIQWELGVVRIYRKRHLLPKLHLQYRELCVYWKHWRRGSIFYEIHLTTGEVFVPGQCRKCWRSHCCIRKQHHSEWQHVHQQQSNKHFRWCCLCRLQHAQHRGNTCKHFHAQLCRAKWRSFVASKQPTHPERWCLHLHK